MQKKTNRRFRGYLEYIYLILVSRSKYLEMLPFCIFITLLEFGLSSKKILTLSQNSVGNMEPG